MAVYSYKLVIGNQFTARDTVTDNTQLLLTKLEGWQTMPAQRRVIKPKLFGSGDYVSGIVQYESKIVVVTMQASFPKNAPITSLLNNISSMARTANVSVEAVLYYYADGVEFKREVIDVYPATNFSEVFEPIDNTVEFTLNFYQPDPYKTVFLNGSSTAESTRRL